MNKIFSYFIAFFMLASPTFAMELDNNCRFEFKNEGAFYNSFAQRRQIDKFEYQNKDISFDFLNHDIIIRGVAVPVTDFGIDFYYKIEPKISEEKIIEKISEKLQQGSLDKQTQLLEQILKLLEKMNSVPTPAPPVNPPEPTPVEPVPIQPVTKEIPEEVKEIFKDRCAVCHSSTSPKDGFDFVNYKYFGNDFTKDEVYEIWDAADNFRMPKNGAPLNQSKIDILKKWLDGYMKN